MAEPTKKLQPTDKSGPPTYAHPSRDPNAPAPNFVSPKGKASGGRKNIKGPAPRADGSQPKSANTDYLLKSEQQQQLQDKGGA
jgi:hypothetical protein